MTTVRTVHWMSALALLLGWATAHAQTPPAAPSAEQRRAETQAAYKAATQASQRGPGDVKLIDQAMLKIPAGMMFVPPAEAGRLLRAVGNRTGDSLVGLLMPAGDRDWWIVVKYVKEGFVKDGDAKEWKADDLLASLKEGTEESNKERAERGFPEIDIIGWIQPPQYDFATHRLSWSLSSRNKGAPADADQGVNYNTYALGRDGYFSLNLLTTVPELPKDKPVVQGLLTDLTYAPGKRYEDFNESTDHIAEYGIAALVGVVAAKKLGLIALGLAFFAKFAKLGVLAVVGAGAVIARFFKRKPKAGPAA